MNYTDKGAGLSLSELKTRLHYCPDSGAFTVVLPRGGRAVGSRAGHSHVLGYRTVNLLGHHYKEHRLAWFYAHGAWPEQQLDHINGDRSDNRLANLRECTQSQNSQNHGVSKASLTGVTGVRFLPRDGVYHAAITVKGKAQHLGSFHTIEEAASARGRAKAALHTFNPADPVRPSFGRGVSA